MEVITSIHFFQLITTFAFNIVVLLPNNETHKPPKSRF
jgi:hypothetical protein